MRTKYLWSRQNLTEMEGKCRSERSDREHDGLVLGPKWIWSLRQEMEIILKRWGDYLKVVGLRLSGGPLERERMDK